MKRAMAAVAMILCAMTARADRASAARASSLMTDLLSVATDMSKEARRDAEVMRRLNDAARALDDWQQNTAVSKAMDAIGKAEQLAAQQPVNPRVSTLVRYAREAVAPAQRSTMNIDQMKIRNELRTRSIEPMRQVVAEDVNQLARLTSQLTDITSVTAKSMAAASAAALGQSE